MFFPFAEDVTAFILRIKRCIFDHRMDTSAIKANLNEVLKCGSELYSMHIQSFPQTVVTTPYLSRLNATLTPSCCSCG